MSGETEKNISGWTVDTLKQHYDDLRSADQRALDAALLAVKEENRKTETAAEKRFDLLNELRQGVATREQIDALEKIVDDLKDRINTSDGQATGSQLTTGKLYAGIGVAVSLIGLIVLLTNNVL